MSALLQFVEDGSSFALALNKHLYMSFVRDFQK